MAGNGASALRPGAPAERGALGKRIASTLVLIPLALAIVWFGAPWFTLAVALCGGVMAWEWGRLIGRRRTAVDGVKLLAIGIGTILLATLIGLLWGALFLLLGILWLWRGGKGPWLALGLLWITVPSIGFVWLRGHDRAGLITVCWLLALVWSVDSAAFAVGKTIGGKRLVPRISPNKTWSGLLGGVAAATLVGGLFGGLLGTGPWWPTALLSGGLAIVEQIGDIAESYAKRHFGAKDSGNLIPGHGGLLDRLDGMLAVVAAVALLTLILNGSVVSWR